MDGKLAKSSATNVVSCLLNKETSNLGLKTKNSGFTPVAVVVGGGQGTAVFICAGIHSHPCAMMATGHTGEEMISCYF